MQRSTVFIVALYLLAIVLANLSVSLAPPAWRASVVLFNAFMLIGLDLTAGDRLHEAWRGPHLVRNMVLLILAGSVLSYALNASAGVVAVASCLAFLLAAIADRLTYAALAGQSWQLRVNVSNMVSAAIDSGVFLAGLAVAGLLPWTAVLPLMLGQWVAKVAGGVLWATLLGARRTRNA